MKPKKTVKQKKRILYSNTDFECLDWNNIPYFGNDEYDYMREQEWYDRMMEQEHADEMCGHEDKEKDKE